MICWVSWVFDALGVCLECFDIWAILILLVVLLLFDILWFGHLRLSDIMPLLIYWFLLILSFFGVDILRCLSLLGVLSFSISLVLGVWCLVVFKVFCLISWVFWYLEFVWCVECRTCVCWYLELFYILCVLTICVFVFLECWHLELFWHLGCFISCVLLSWGVLVSVCARCLAFYYYVLKVWCLDLCDVCLLIYLCFGYLELYGNLGFDILGFLVSWVL